MAEAQEVLVEHQLARLMLLAVAGLVGIVVLVALQVWLDQVAGAVAEQSEAPGLPVVEEEQAYTVRVLMELQVLVLGVVEVVARTVVEVVVPQVAVVLQISAVVEVDTAAVGVVLS
jgi:hypothetical protein